MKINLKDINIIGMRTGKTTAICKAAAEIGATVIVHNAQEAFRIKNHYGVKALPLDAELRGSNGPYLVDPHAASYAAFQYENKIAELEHALRNLYKLTEDYRNWGPEDETWSSRELEEARFHIEKLIKV